MSLEKLLSTARHIADAMNHLHRAQAATYYAASEVGDLKSLTQAIASIESADAWLLQAAADLADLPHSPLQLREWLKRQRQERQRQEAEDEG